MQPEAALLRLPQAVSRFPHQWRAPVLYLLAAWAVLLALLWRDWMAMFDQWWNSSTYNHILLIPLILAWLVMLRVRELSRFTPQAWWPGLAFVAGSLFIWLLGSLSGLDLASAIGAVMALQAVVIALFGPRVAVGLAFPLFYMFFLVPFGDELVPFLQTVTAELTIQFTRWSGIPAHIEGVFIETPAGLFEVAEACSGVKFLIAMVALGTLVAHLCFLSWKRRLAFMMLAAVLPVLANGVRAWGTIYIAQYKGLTFAAGFDHIVYGWVFFAIVMAATLGLAWRYFDRPPDDRFIDPERIASSALLSRISHWQIDARAALGTIAAMALAASLWASFTQQLEAAMPEAIALPHVPGWQRTAYQPQFAWEPRAQGAAHRLLGRYRNARGQEADIFLALYPSQRAGLEATAMGEGALMADDSWSWIGIGPDFVQGQSERLLADWRVERLAVTYYRSGDLLTASKARVKLASMANKLALRTRPTIMLIVSAEERSGYPAAESVAAFLDSVGPLEEWMDRIARLR